MKFHLKGVLALAVSLLSVGAYADNVTTLELVQTSGATAQFALSSSPVITTSRDSLFISAGAQQVKAALSEVKLYHFVNSTATGISKVDNNGAAERTFRDGVIAFAGLRPASSILVATVDGKIVANVRAAENGSATIDLNAFGHGLYIVRTSTGSYKYQF